MCKQPTKQSCEQQGSKQGGHPNVLPNTGSWIHASAAPCGGFTINRTNSRKSPTQGGGLMLLSKKFFSWAFMSRAAQGVTRSREVCILLQTQKKTKKKILANNCYTRTAVRIAVLTAKNCDPYSSSPHRCMQKTAVVQLGRPRACGKNGYRSAECRPRPMGSFRASKPIFFASNCRF